MSEYRISQHDKDEITRILQNISSEAFRINQIISNAQVFGNGRPIALPASRPILTIKEQLMLSAPKLLLGANYEKLYMIENAQPVATTTTTSLAKLTIKEQLTPGAINRLLGANYDKVCIYKNETQTLLTQNYNDKQVFWNNYTTNQSRHLKDLFEKIFPEFELVAQVTKQVSAEDYPGWGKWTTTNKAITFDKDGKCTIGNLIVRNKKTGALGLFNANAWFGVYKHRNCGHAARFDAHMLAHIATVNAGFRAALFAGGNGR